MDGSTVRESQQHGKWKYACHGKGFWWKVCFVCVLLIAYYGDLKGVSMNRYSLLMHHGEEELRRFGLTDEMLIDQEW